MTLQRSTGQPARGGARALEGVRVVDLSWVRAGPWGTRILGTLGAEVIKVEWPAPGSVHHNDRYTNTGRPEHIEPNLNNSHWFSEKNVNKLSVTLNLRNPRSRELLKRLIAVSDVVIENFTSRVMQRWELGYEQLREIKPDIIYVSLSALGHSGPDHPYRTYGPSAQALSGMTYLSGLPGEPPAGWGWSYLDDTGGIYGAIAVMTALHHRHVTGRGQHVDLSQVGAGLALSGPAILDATVNGRAMRREGFPPGNRTHWPGTPLLDNYRGPMVAPHNAYRTALGGYNDWCAIVCRNDEQWRALGGVMGDPEWARAPRFAGNDGRLEHQEELDRQIEAWTQTLEKYELAERCQASGVPAMPVQSNEDRVQRDPQLRHRAMFTELPHAGLGPMGYQNLPFRGSAGETTSRTAAPLIGEHNREVLCGLLGLSEQELREGYRDDSIWPEDLPLEPYLEAETATGSGASS